MKCRECFRELANNIRNHKFCLFLSLFIIEAIVFISIPIYHCMDNKITVPVKLEKWSAVSDNISLDEGLNNLTVISISHWPPRPVRWDGNIIITINIDASDNIRINEKTPMLMYVYICDGKNKKSGLLHSENITQTGRLKFQIDMGSDNFSNITNAELYILDSNRKVARAKQDILPHKFDVTSVNNYLNMMGVLATITAVVVALLSLWAQLNARLVNEKSGRSRKLAAALNLFWIYLAVFIAFLSLIAFLSAFSPGIKVTPTIMPLYYVGWGLLISSIVMFVLSVFESLVSMFVTGVYKLTTPFDPTFVFPVTRFDSYYKCAFVFLIFFALLICITLLCLIADGFSWWPGWLFIPMVACVGIVIVHTLIVRQIYHVIT